MRYAVLALLLCSGCGSLLQAPTASQPAPAPAPPPVDQLRQVKAGLDRSALLLEEKGDRRGALEKRRILAAVSHDDSFLAESVRLGEERLGMEAEENYRLGLKQHRLGDFEAARKHYLSALRLDPDHRGALEEIKNGLAGDNIVLTLRQETTLSDIAGMVYGNSDLAMVLAAVNSLKVSRPVPAGARLTVPQLDDSLLTAVGGPGASAGRGRRSRPAAAADRPDAYTGEKPPTSESILASARKLFNERRFREAVEEAGKIHEDDPLAPEAREIINGSYFRIGGRLADEGRLPMALDAYRRVDRSYRNAGETISLLEKRMTDMAEEHYIAGVKFFVSQRLEEAITEWEKTLGLNPSHEKAGEDIRKAMKLLEELQKVQDPAPTAPK